MLATTSLELKVFNHQSWEASVHGARSPEREPYYFEPRGTRSDWSLSTHANASADFSCPTHLRKKKLCRRTRIFLLSVWAVTILVSNSSSTPLFSPAPRWETQSQPALARVLEMCCCPFHCWTQLMNNCAGHNSPNHISNINSPIRLLEGCESFVHNRLRNIDWNADGGWKCSCHPQRPNCNASRN